jgi:membrane protein YdbS with pleckstrin-like domain
MASPAPTRLKTTPRFGRLGRWSRSGGASRWRRMVLGVYRGPLPPCLPPALPSLDGPWGRRALGTLHAVPISADLLDDDEDVLVDLRPHWVFFLGPLFLTAASIAVAVVVFHEFPKAPVAVAYVLAIVIGVPALWLIGRLARWFGTSLVVTDRRIVFRSGVLGRRVVNLRMQRIVDTHCTQKPLERLIGSGRLILEVEGEEGGLALDDVRRPRALQRVINRQLNQMDAGWQLYRSPSTAERGPGDRDRSEGARPDWTPPSGQPATRGAPEAGQSIPDQLVALDRLRRQGILSDEEFADKKAELLGRI